MLVKSVSVFNRRRYTGRAKTVRRLALRYAIKEFVYESIRGLLASRTPKF